MATIKITLDKRSSNTTIQNKYPLVLRISHKRKTRDISFNIHLHENQYDSETGKITGILNAVRHTKRTRKTYSDIDLWIDENEGAIKHWEIAKLKQEIEQRFFKIQPSRTLLNYGAIYLNRLRLEERFSTASSYEDALKSIVKYKRHIKGEDDTEKIKSLFELKDNTLVVLDEYKPYDMEIIAIDYSFSQNFKAYLTNRYKSKNTPAIFLPSIQAIMNDAGKAFSDLKDHKPLARLRNKVLKTLLLH